MLTSYYAARANLYSLYQHHPEWSHVQLATALGASQSWVDTWLKRFREELAQAIPLEQILQGHSRACLTPPAHTPAEVVQEVLTIRDQLPEGLRRVPGPKAIRYYLSHDPLMALFGLALPSTKTIARILKTSDRIASRQEPVHTPIERPAPMISLEKGNL